MILFVSETSLTRCINISISCIFPKALLSLVIFINSNTYLLFDFVDVEPSQGSWRYTEAAWPCPVTRANQEKLRARNSGKNTVLRNILFLYWPQRSFLGNLIKNNVRIVALTVPLCVWAVKQVTSIISLPLKKPLSGKGSYYAPSFLSFLISPSPRRLNLRFTVGDLQHFPWPLLIVWKYKAVAYPVVLVQPLSLHTTSCSQNEWMNLAVIITVLFLPKYFNHFVIPELQRWSTEATQNYLPTGKGERPLHQRSQRTHTEGSTAHGGC